MRKSNPKRFTRRNDRCNCEHQNHFTDRYDDVLRANKKVPRLAHRYMLPKAGDAWAAWVGHVCDECARTCMVGWIIDEHVCGTGDCHR